MAWRKGADVDQELWPAEAFGGVSDEQFWDDLAADKPLATTARTAQPDGGARRRPNAGPLPELRSGDDRTEIRPVQPPTQPSVQPTQPSVQPTQPSVQPTQPSPNATQPARTAYQGAGMSPDEDPLTSPAYSLRPKTRSHQSQSPRRPDQYEAATSQDTQIFSVAETQAATSGYPGGVPPFRQFDQPARGNGPARSDPPRSDPPRSDPPRSDPRAQDGYRTDPPRAGQLRPAYRSGSAPAQGGAYNGTDRHTPHPPQAANPYPPPPRGVTAQPGNAGSAANTPPYGEMYGYGDPSGYASPAGDPRRGNGGRSPGRESGGGSEGSRHAYPPADGQRSPRYPQEHGRR